MGSVSVGSIPLISIVSTFVFYLASHSGIGLWMNNTKLKYEKNKKNEDAEKLYKFLKILFTWYPFCFVLIVIMNMVL